MQATKRLQNDYKQLCANPLVGAFAQPKEDNLFLWDGAIVVDIKDKPKTILHFLISFPLEYPMKPPNVGFSTRFNYRSGAISQIGNGPLQNKWQVCLDLVGNYSAFHTEWEKTKGSGWSPAYTVSTLLVNLQSVVLEAIDTSNKQNYQNEFDFEQYDGKGQSIASQNEILWRNCTQYLDVHQKNLPEALLKLMDSDCTGDDEKSVPTPKKREVEINCWYSHQSYKDGTLGFGIRVDQQGKRKVFVTDAEFISFDAFKDGLRSFPTKETFHYFIPAWICKEHATTTSFTQALDKFHQAFKAECNITAEVEVIMRIYPDLINGMIVKLMDKTSDLKVSFKCFTCLLNVWRVFLYLVRDRKISDLQQSVEYQVNQFVGDVKYRDKNNTPNIGNLLVYTSVCDMDDATWGNFMEVYVDEFFLRQVFWWQKNKVTIDAKSTLQASEIGRKNVLFQILLQRKVLARGDISQAIEESGCMMEAEMETLLKEWKDICARDKSWTAFFTECVALGFPQAQKDAICANGLKFLTGIVDRANKLQGYHFSVQQKYRRY